MSRIDTMKEEQQTHRGLRRAVRKQDLGANAKYLKQKNQSVILNLLNRHTGVSRADLARVTGLNPSTISALIGEFIESGIVREQGRAVLESAGRRPELLELIPEARFAMGIYLGDVFSLGLIMDLAGHIVESFDVATPAEGTPHAVLRYVFDEARGMLARWGGDRSKLLGATLAIPGLVDSEAGIALFSPNMGWHDIEVGAEMQHALDIPAFVENDVRALALGEQWFGLGQHVDSLACLHIGTGVGCGVIMQGEIYRGATGGGGEIGHTVVAVDGPLCRCGNYGCLETLAGGQAILAKAMHGMASSIPSLLRESTNDDLRRLSLHLVFEAVRKGDQLARSAVEQTITYMAIALANVINTFNPDLVILSGELITEGEDVVVERMVTLARTHIYGAAARETPIQITNLGKNGNALGAACLVFQYWLASAW